MLRSRLIRLGGPSGFQYRCFTVSGKVWATLPAKEKTLAKFDFARQTDTISTIDAKLDRYINSKVTLHGWINNKPRKISKNLVFVEFRDTNGDVTQLLANTEGPALENLKNASMEDAICVAGTVQRRRAKKSEELESEKWDLILQDYSILNKSNDTPSQLQELVNSDEFPPHLRYLQLRQKFYQDALKTRAKAASTVRKALAELGFTEIETPLLFKSTPEGAREFLVPTRREGQFYALPQSPQQYKQLLMASGVKRYYQIAKCFRDEDLRKDRQPEFTQIDMELAFSKPEDVQDSVSDMVKQVWANVKNLSLFTLQKDVLVEVGSEGEFTKLTYNEALANYGIDKPDLRSALKMENLTDKKYGIKVKGDHASEFSVFEVLILRGAFAGKEKIPSEIFSSHNYANRKPVIVPIKLANDASTWLDKFRNEIEFESPADEQRLIRDLNLQPGDIIAGSTRAQLSYENPTPIGRFRQLAIDNFPNKWRRKLVQQNTGNELSNVDPQDVFVATWVVDFPLFSPLEVSNDKEYPVYEYTKFSSTHHPFTMCKPADYELLASDPLQVHGEHYDLVINGVELGGGSRRIHDTELQRYIFSDILRIDNPDRLFGHLLSAFDVGCPPHSGLAIGFDRMCAMLINSQSIRDVVAFPKSKIGADAVVGSPSHVTDKVLEQYFVKKTSG